MVTECAEQRPQPTGISSGTSIRLDGRSGTFDQATVRHTTRTSRLTTPTLDARGKRLDHLGVERLLSPLHGAHESDATTR